MEHTGSSVHLAPVAYMVCRPAVAHALDRRHSHCGEARAADRWPEDPTEWRPSPRAYQICDICGCGSGIWLGGIAETAVLKKVGIHPGSLAPLFAVP